MARATSIVSYKVPSGKAEEVNARLRAHVLPEAQRLPGFCGYLVVDQEDGTRLDIWIFDSAEALAGMDSLDKVAREQIVPLTGPPTAITSGAIVISDGIFPGA